MKVVVAIDSFKGSLTSEEAGNAAKAGILRAIPEAEVIVRPMADGGEGTVDALAAGRTLQRITAHVTGPLGTPAEAQYVILDGSIAVMEMSRAAGITMVPRQNLDPRRATTFGVGEMIIDALDRGVRSFVLGIGGSATNDGGAGMLRALGYGLLDGNGAPIPNGAAGLASLSQITDEQVRRELASCTFRVVCDVNNPLTGERGASAVFGPQKGADPGTVALLDRWLGHFARISSDYLVKQGKPAADPDYPGSGAAGGLGFALRNFLGASLEPGVKLVLEFTRMEDAVKDADILVTGEGRIDRQTVMGKAPSGIAGLGRKYGIPVIAFSGSVTEDAGYCNDHGITAFFPVLRSIVTLEEAMDPAQAKKNMADTAEQVFRLISMKERS